MTRKGQIYGLVGWSGIILTSVRAWHSVHSKASPSLSQTEGPFWTFISLIIIHTMSCAAPGTSGMEGRWDEKSDMARDLAKSIQKAKNDADRARYRHRSLIKQQVFAPLRWLLGGFWTQKGPTDVHECTHLAEGFAQSCPRALSPPWEIDPTHGGMRPGWVRFRFVSNRQELRPQRIFSRKTAQRPAFNFWHFGG